MDFAPKKSLGQHWLVSEGHVRKIVDAVGDARGILEIGPGKGILTAPLSAKAPVIALELDPRMAEATLRAAPNAEVITGDVLTADIGGLLDSLERPVAVVSNLPYYITAAVVSRLIEVSERFDIAVLMMQEEVANKLMAEAGNARRGSLSVAVQRHFVIESVTKVPPGAFNPPPKVDSRVLRLVSKGVPVDKSLEALVRKGFTQPRKTLANNLGNREIIERAGLSPSGRPHQLLEEDWVLLGQLARSPKS
ncbi:MAG: 16S rRNA (adenine(1518)-N(6)/adenine(1519)-N(6))-dimethyltransferase RsmA [Armatimonadota bacterium]|nr:16S rRNA (adenine(1518)-N(6)/adenine(1519)-N(6))-dimethyltransferase RsmA [Armatimonadota bacterium]